MAQAKFNSMIEYLDWAKSQSWYQSISLSCGYKTTGNIDSEKRNEVFSRYDFKGKRVLDIGCNSGLYCLMAKRLGAKEVIGLEPNKNRIEQARIISVNEETNIRYINKGIECVPEMGQFDIVICIAVLTEIQNILGAIEIIKSATKEIALIEMDIAKPSLYLPSPRKIYRLLKNKQNINVFAEARKTKRGWMLSPSLGLLKILFGNDFIIRDLGKSLRYRMLEIKRR